MKYHVAIDITEERLKQLKIVAIRLGIPIRKLVAEIVDGYLTKNEGDK